MEFKKENKYCPIILSKGKFSLSLLSLEYGLSKEIRNTVFLVPCREFIACGSIWRELNLCTIFWEHQAWGMKKDSFENEKTKIAYLIAFASNIAPICKKWADDCLNKTIKYQELNDTVYFKIELYDENLKDKIITAVRNFNFNLSINDNIYTVY
jgi:hypothetical protein